MAYFLRTELAKKFVDKEIFTTGTGCKDKGIEKYKRKLKPAFTKDYYYILVMDD